MKYCYLNGEITTVDTAQVGITDLSLLRGYGIFDYFLFSNGQPRFLEDYIDRFFRSAAYLRLQLPMSRDQLRQAILDVIRLNAQEEGGVRLVLTGGYSENGYEPTEGNFFILQYPLPTAPDHHYTEGASLATWELQRQVPEVKSINYLTGIKILPWLSEQKADYPLYHDGTYVRESDRSNFFLVNQAGTLVTPATKVLGGITRAKALEIARRLGIPVEEREVEIAELYTAKEAMLTSSIKGVLPIVTIDEKTIGTGQPGAISQQLHAEYMAMIRENEYQL